ncbi:MAG: hypothetical protein JSV16_07145 [Candidatus Hydrogenedentota bacterium]|nr:MAG: hypothetical protein JSV16_07145 [Candidatus Hydrogenedentota bacterium]
MFAHNYIVRIYRRDEKNPARIVGVVEEVEAQEKRAFEDFDELRAILETPKGALTRTGGHGFLYDEK